MGHVNNFTHFVREKLVYNRILNPDFWQNGQFDPATRTKLLQIAHDFYADLKIDAPIVDIHLTGSMANYNWSDTSDLDVHVHVDFAEVDDNVELVQKALEGQKFIWNLRHPVLIKGHDVELYIQDKKKHTISSGIYSLLKDEWINKPVYDLPTVDMHYVADKVESYKNEIEELSNLLTADNIDDARLIFDRAKVLKKKISSIRDASLRKEGEFSIENLVFKELRNQGYIGKLIKLQAKAYSAIYSDAGFKPDDAKIMQEEEKPIKKEINGDMKRIVESFSDWLNADMAINENIAAAKVYMQKELAKRLSKNVADLTPEERERALGSKGYKAILDILKDQPGYVMPFVKFHYEQRVPLEDLSALAVLIKTKKHIIQQLSRSVDQYSATPEVNGVSGFEALNDEIRTIKREKEAKWIIERLPSRLKAKYRELPPSEQKVLLNAAHHLTALGKEITDRLFQKIKSMENLPIQEVVEYIVNFIKGYANLDVKKKMDKIAELDPEAGVLYMDDRFMVLSLRTEKAQKALCDVANWCINRGLFSSYVSAALQINIFDFAENPGSPLFLTGNTVSYQGKVTNSHDLNDSNFFGQYENGVCTNNSYAASNALASRKVYPSTRGCTYQQHFHNLGYPDILVHAVEAQFQNEVMVKKIVYDLGLNTYDTKTLLVNIIKQSYALDPGTSAETLLIILDIVRTRINPTLSREQVVDLYAAYGVASKFSAYLLAELLPEATESEKKRIIEKTMSLFKIMNAAVRKYPNALNKFPQFKNTIPQQRDILQGLGVPDDQIDTIMESLTQVDAEIDALLESLTMDAPAPVKTPTRTPTKTPTKPSTPNKPGPIPTRQPHKTPEPAKAEADEVIKRLEALNGR